jgi:hypothetical protein
MRCHATAVAGSSQPDAAKRLIGFIASAGAATAIRSSGMDPIGVRRP